METEVYFSCSTRSASSRNNTLTTMLSVIFLYLHVSSVLQSLLTLRITFLCCGSTSSQLILSKRTRSIISCKSANIKTNSKQDTLCNIVTFFFYVLLTVHLSVFISVINQLDAQNLCFTISLFLASIYFEHMCSKHEEA